MTDAGSDGRGERSTSQADDDARLRAARDHIAAAQRAYAERQRRERAAAEARGVRPPGWTTEPTHVSPDVATRLTAIASHVLAAAPAPAAPVPPPDPDAERARARAARLEARGILPDRGEVVYAPAGPRTPAWTACRALAAHPARHGALVVLAGGPPADATAALCRLVGRWPAPARYVGAFDAAAPETDWEEHRAERARLTEVELLAIDGAGDEAEALGARLGRLLAARALHGGVTVLATVLDEAVFVRRYLGAVPSYARRLRDTQGTTAGPGALRWWVPCEAKPEG